ncbi:unnamed protein product [Prorocentrum cordatum]|uniref:RRM domain-containing protein n=1 Tax=Prorocentrum cordatum TaxID=2364126 RepID=A0ABN9SNZ7_9DINO|nr:unnamed protein product [Polarella glacialis]
MQGGMVPAVVAPPEKKMKWTPGGPPADGMPEGEVRFEQAVSVHAAVALSGTSLGGSTITVIPDATSKDGTKITELKDHFKSCGAIAHADVKGQGAGHRRGAYPSVGQVRMATAQEAEKAMQLLNGSQLMGSTIEVKLHSGSKDATKLQISGIPPGAAWQELKDHFASCGTVAHAETTPIMPGHQITGEVRFEDPQHAQLALKTLNGSQLGTSQIFISLDQWSTDKTKLLITGIAPGTDWQELKDHFASMGTIAYADVHKLGGKKGGGKGWDAWGAQGGCRGAVFGGCGGAVFGGGKGAFGAKGVFGGAGGGGGKGFPRTPGALTGTVRYENPYSAQMAVAQLNGIFVNGAQLQVDKDWNSQDGTKLWVGGIPPGTGWQDLKDRLHFLYSVLRDVVAFSSPAREPVCHCHFEGNQCEPLSDTGCRHIERILTRQLESVQSQLSASVTVTFCISLAFSFSLVCFLAGLLVGDLQILDTATVRFEPLARGRPVPERCRNDCFLFDPIPVRELSEAIARAKVLADIAGEDIEVDDAEVWVVSDTSHPRFGEQVEPGILDDAGRALLRDTKGVVQLDANDASTEVHVERVNQNDLADWKSRVGGGGDLRLLGTFRTAGGKRFLQAKDAVAKLEETKFDDFPFADPRAVKEYLGGILETTDGSFDSYHQNWCVAAGVSPNSGIAHDHRIILEALRLGLTYDQYNLANSAMGEQLVRRLIQHELAVEKDAKHPDYSGLGYMLAGSTEDKGRVAVPKFTRWIAEKQHQRAFTLKQSRLLREERAAEDKRRGGGQKGFKGASKGNKGDAADGGKGGQG